MTAAVSLVVLSAGCSSSDSGTPATADSDATQDPTADAGAVGSSKTSTLVPLITAPQPTTEPDAAEGDPERPRTDIETVEQLWIDFITAATSRAGPAQIEPLASEPVRTAANAVFTEPRLPVTFHPQIEVDAAGETAHVEDCSLLSFPLVDFPYIPMTGQATKSDDSWRITALEVQPEARCIPSDIASEVFSAYERFWDNELTFSDPPDPKHPLIEQTLTGRRLQRKRAVLDWQVENHAAFRGRPMTNPGISDFQPGLMMLIDCQTPNPETGFYDLTTGERRPELPPPNPGQTDLVRTWLELDDDRWKVEFSGIEVDTGCDPDRAPDAIPVVGLIEP